MPIRGKSPTAHQTMKDILLYADEGVCPAGLLSLFHSLHEEQLHHHFHIKRVDRRYLIDSCWEKQTALIVIPGGRDLPYHRALAGQGNRRIRAFVEQGGQYLGICAGGYYGCASIEFEKGQPLEVVGVRELAFFPGVARGPAYGPGQFCYATQQGARIAQLDLAGHTRVAAYYNGGCAFVDGDDALHVQVLARYSDIEGAPAAVVECVIGEGRALLSGVHPEYSAKHAPVECGDLIPALEAIEPSVKSCSGIYYPAWLV